MLKKPIGKAKYITLGELRGYVHKTYVQIVNGFCIENAYLLNIMYDEAPGLVVGGFPHVL